ncbi:DoxX-like family protein [Flavipsychrobacter stenotrophus]|uniref:DoxX-like family protein n=1 Tax=Flavipsychrobacter stenotrophus TaxID=2077091 RepID=A0A2S7SPZ0_9BACT|nr:DoxX family protein [Flavipsychrobacter stenotrophus]PQJ08788.1 DoxX-like family protein [Flavipsychrobacter stenotrophus]
MNKGRLITYWVATALLSFGMLGSGVAQVFQLQQMKDLVIPLGYPVYFLCIIGVWKILGVIAILLPGFKLLKEWAYAGFFFVMTGALVSHLSMGDYDLKAIMGPVMQTVFIILSWYCRPVDRKIVSGN